MLWIAPPLEGGLGVTVCRPIQSAYMLLSGPRYCGTQLVQGGGFHPKKPIQLA